MSERVGPEEGATGHLVSWFLPERPVNGTIFVRPDADPVEDPFVERTVGLLSADQRSRGCSRYARHRSLVTMFLRPPRNIVRIGSEKGELGCRPITSERADLPETVDGHRIDASFAPERPVQGTVFEHGCDSCDGNPRAGDC